MSSLEFKLQGGFSKRGGINANISEKMRNMHRNIRKRFYFCEFANSKNNKLKI